MQGQRIAPSAQRQIAALLSEKASRSPAERKMSAILVHAAKILRGEKIHPEFPNPTDALAAVRLDTRQRVEVDIRGEVTPELLAHIGALGGTVVNSFPGYRAIRANLPLVSVKELAADSGVTHIRAAEATASQQETEPLLRTRAGATPQVQSVAAELRRYFGREPRRFHGLWRSSRMPGGAFFVGPDLSGDVAHQANVARATYSVDGTGVKVGVLSSGVDSLITEQAAGRLPAVNVLPGQRGTGDEGTAILEVLYTMAPGATLYFATANGGQPSMANNIQALADAGCQIILDDIIYLAEPVFQEGIIAQRVNAVAAAGVFYFSAAGNDGRTSANTSDTWEGDFLDSGFTLGFIDPAARMQSFAGFAGNRITAPSPIGHYSLAWSDPLGKSTDDYDLFILNADLSAVVASSTDVQNGTENPQESIYDPGHRVVAGDWIVILRNSGAATRALHLATWFGRIASSTNGNIVGHNAAAGGFAVAAANVLQALGGAFTGYSNLVDSYSSAGPRRLFFQPDGTAITPGNVLFNTSGGLLLSKPDFAAADGVTTGLSSFNPFFGTSAAVPHAAAIAALMLQSNPSVTVAGMRAALSASAIAAGSDSGAGIVMAPRAIAQAPKQCSYWVSSAGDAYSSASGTGSITVSAPAICLWSVSASDPWIIFNSASSNSGMGNGTITYQVSANSGAARWGTITVADQVFTVEQNAFDVPGAVSVGSLAQVVSAGNWKMTFDFLNLGTTTAQLQANFYTDSYPLLPLPFTFPQLSPPANPLMALTLERSLPPGAQFIAETTGPANKTTEIGWAQLVGNGKLSGFGIFSDSATKGEAVVPLETRNASTYVLAFDNTGGVVTGVALANPSSSVSVYAPMIIRDDAGNQIGATSAGLSPMSHYSFSFGSETFGKRGTVEFDLSPGMQLSVLGLRFTSTSLFTTIPVFANVGPGTGSMAHLASGGGWDSTITLVNVGPASARAQVHFFDDSGKALSLPITFPQTPSANINTSSLDRTLEPYQTLLLETTGPESTPVKVGSMQVSSDGSISGFIVFHRTMDGQEAVVPLEVRKASAYVLPFDNTSGLVAGVAVANTSAQAVNIPVVIRDDNGAQIGTGAVALPANGHTSFVLTDRFAVAANRRGTIEFDTPSGGQISALGLRFTENGFTTIPVFGK
jgi:hypothetical protein